MVLPAGQQPCDIVEVRFKGNRKEFYRNKENIQLSVGDVVAVEAAPGHDIGIVSITGELVKLQMRKRSVGETSDQIKTLYRKAKPADIEKWNQVKGLEARTLNRTREIILTLKLSMKLSDVEYQGDGKKATFYYTADERVDFRELIKKLAEEFHVRVEMRQVGMRQEAGRLGGIGSCGRELCCSTWLTDFKTVSTSAARYQNLALNPAKLAGQCGKLKCCLNYELDTYLDALRDFPKADTVLHTQKGRATHRKTDIFKRRMWFAYSGVEDREQADLIEGGEGGNWVELSVDRVKEIVALNKQSIKPDDLAEMVERETESKPDYHNVVGQDRIDRMDKKKKKKKKRKPEGREQSKAASQTQQNQPKPPPQGQPSKPQPPQPNTQGTKPTLPSRRPPRQQPPKAQ